MGGDGSVVRGAARGIWSVMMSDIARDACIAFDGLCRLSAERQINGVPQRGTAFWLMCNPSDADAFIDDPTVGRVMHHSLRAGCNRSLIGNAWAYRTPYPKDLWAALAAGRYTAEMSSANIAWVAAMAAQADVVFVAFGAEPWRRYRSHMEYLIDVIRSASGGKPLMCLGTAGDGAPLHPLARGKFAVRNDCEIMEWSTSLRD